MPRPARAQGRPGTGVFPKGWESSHAVVVAKTCTATVKIWPSASVPATINDDLSYTAAEPGAPIYTGSARIQVLATDTAVKVLGDQARASVTYRVVVDRDAPTIHRGALVEVTSSSDPTLSGDRRLVVAQVDRGSLRWERDLYCIDELEEA